MSHKFVLRHLAWDFERNVDFLSKNHQKTCDFYWFPQGHVVKNRIDGFVTNPFYQVQIVKICVKIYVFSTKNAFYRLQIVKKKSCFFLKKIQNFKEWRISRTRDSHVSVSHWGLLCDHLSMMIVTWPLTHKMFTTDSTKKCDDEHWLVLQTFVFRWLWMNLSNH